MATCFFAFSLSKGFSILFLLFYYALSLRFPLYIFFFGEKDYGRGTLITFCFMSKYGWVFGCFYIFLSAFLLGRCSFFFIAGFITVFCHGETSLTAMVLFDGPIRHKCHYLLI